MPRGDKASTEEQTRLVALCDEIGYEAAASRTGRSVKGLRELAGRVRRAARKGAAA